MTSMLRLVNSSSAQQSTRTHLLQNTERSKLRSMCGNSSSRLHEEAILELARRKDTDLLQLLELMLMSESHQEYSLAIRALAILGTDDAIETLVMRCAQSIGDDRVFCVGELARCLTADHVRPFSLLIRQLVRLGEIDVNGWTNIAIRVVQEVCRQEGIRIKAVPSLSSQVRGQLVEMHER